MNDFGPINNDGEFEHSYKEIYLPSLNSRKQIQKTLEGGGGE